MSTFFDAILGKPLSTADEKGQKLGVLTGVPVLGLDALASTAYGPEAALMILLPLGSAGLHYFPYIVGAVLIELVALYASYMQTIAAYPNGGGAYIVTRENLGRAPALWAAVSLLVDYLLNVTVGIAAGVGAMISALPELHAHALILCLIVLAVLTLLNLRGVRETGLTFLAPVFGFVVLIAVAIAIGLAHAVASGGHPLAVVAPPALPPPTAKLGILLLISAFANGCTAMTGVEAVSNGVPLFAEPRVANSRWTLSVIVIVLGLFVLALGLLCPAYQIRAMDELQPGYQTVLSQLLAAVWGHGVFYYVGSGLIFMVLICSAQTSFADFPRVCWLLAEDDFLPLAFANRNRRLVFSHGIVVLATLAAVVLTIFGGITLSLIPLFAIGAFSAFIFSQVGMVRHWSRQGGRGAWIKLTCNGLGAATTATALIAMLVTKFVAGAWLVVIVVPALVLLLARIRRHFGRLEREVEQPLQLKPQAIERPLVVIPVTGWDRVSEKALRVGLRLSDQIIAVYVSTDQGECERLRRQWQQMVEEPARAAAAPVPRLVVLDSPYRRVLQPFVDFIARTLENNPSRSVAVVIPELREPHWYGYLLHNQRAAWIKARLYMAHDERLVIVSAPWELRDG